MQLRVSSGDHSLELLEHADAARLLRSIVILDLSKHFIQAVVNISFYVSKQLSRSFKQLLDLLRVECLVLFWLALHLMSEVRGHMLR